MYTQGGPYFPVLDKNRFGVFVWQCRVTSSFASAGTCQLRVDGEVVKRRTIFNNGDWVVFTTKPRPPIAAFAHNQQPSCDIVMEKQPHTTLNRIAGGGFKDIGVTYLNMLVKM